MDVSIVIPAYNEEIRIVSTLEKIYRYFTSRGMKFEIIVVDDGSKDNTVQVVEQWRNKKFLLSASPAPPPLRGEGSGEGDDEDRGERIRIISHPVNKGKGAAVRTGVLAARGDLILFSDADLSTPIEEFEKLKRVIDEGFDIAIGSRGLPDSKIVVPQPWYRRYIGKIFPYLVRLIVMKDFKDTQCGFKLFRKETGKDLFSRLKTEGFAFDVEILYRAVKGKWRTIEIPVMWINSRTSRVNVLMDPLKMVLGLLIIRYKGRLK